MVMFLTSLAMNSEETLPHKLSTWIIIETYMKPLRDEKENGNDRESLPD